MDDAALIAVELGGACDCACVMRTSFLVAIDRIGDTGAMVVGEQEEAAVLEGFGRLAPETNTAEQSTFA